MAYLFYGNTFSQLVGLNYSYSTPKDTWKLHRFTLSHSNYKPFLNFIVDCQTITILFYNIFIS